MQKGEEYSIFPENYFPARHTHTHTNTQRSLIDLDWPSFKLLSKCNHHPQRERERERDASHKVYPAEVCLLPEGEDRKRSVRSKHHSAGLQGMHYCPSLLVSMASIVTLHAHGRYRR